MARRTILLAGVAVALALTTAACTAPDDDTASTPKPTFSASQPSATPSSTGTDEPGVVGDNSSAYASIDELKTAVTAGGAPCDGWVQKDAVEGATASGTCANGLTLAIYADGAARDASLNADQASAKPGLWLVGKNWLIGYPDGGDISDLDPLLASLGGFVVPSGS